MQLVKILFSMFLVVTAQNAAGYGSSSSTKACAKPKFSQFSPEHLANVSPGAEFSFIASSKTLPDSIRVTVKNQVVQISVDKKGTGYLVSGKLPESIKDTHARISIQANAAKKCKGTGGWLVKVVE